jgi:hypothetical protein
MIGRDALFFRSNALLVERLVAAAGLDAGDLMFAISLWAKELALTAVPSAIGSVLCGNEGEYYMLPAPLLQEEARDRPKSSNLIPTTSPSAAPMRR